MGTRGELRRDGLDRGNGRVEISSIIRANLREFTSGDGYTLVLHDG